MARIEGAKVVRFVALVMLAVFPAAALANPHEARLPLKDGKIPLSDFSAAVCRELHVRPVRIAPGDLDLNGLNGSTFIDAVNQSLGDGCRVTLTPTALILHVDPDRLPRDGDAARRAVRIFTAVEAPQATAAQRRLWGLHLPEPVDPKRPIVILVHGLNCDSDMWGPMVSLLQDAGYQAATFGYPGDGPLDESAALFGQHFAALRQKYPQARIEVVAHSMGGLVSRGFIEGPDYRGGIDRLILLGTPNAGSTWARFRLLLDAQQQYHLWRTNPEWRATWIITDGLGEASRDLEPGSKFLKRLNARPRRDGVRYTIIAGSQNPASRVGADWVEATSHLIPQRASGWWGLRQAKRGLAGKAETLRHRTGDGDGPVPLASARLAGVTDFVVLPVDHATLAMGNPPAAWSVVRDRLAQK